MVHDEPSVYFETGLSSKVGIYLSPLKQTVGGLQTLQILEKEVALREEIPRVRLLEGCEYEYLLSNKDFKLSESGRATSVIFPNKLMGGRQSGRIRTGLNVGNMELVLLTQNGKEVGRLPIEIRSVKIDYHIDFNTMLSFIADRCTDLLLQIRSPVSGRLAPEPGESARTIGQKFEFLKSLIGAREFQDAVNRITIMPHQRLEQIESLIPAAKGFKTASVTLKNLTKGSKRISLPSTHPLSQTISSLPILVKVQQNKTTVDTPENRFVQFALRSFLSFLTLMRKRLEDLEDSGTDYLKREVRFLEKKLEIILSRPLFRKVSVPHILPLGSPVLQRKGGYRELYRAWLNFDAAARLVWSSGDEIYYAGRRDVAMLYEYWVFFKLLEIVSSVFDITALPAEELIEQTKDGFGLKLKVGNHIAIQGICGKFGRCLRVRFSFNRSFHRRIVPGTQIGNVEQKNYPLSGSWTARMRPDYTLTLWPEPYTEKEADERELLVHIHLDAKYRVDYLNQVFGEDDSDLTIEQREIDLTEEKNDQRNQKYKRADLLKMHAYRDAIRRTAGAYIIYPGDKTRIWKSFHEILPGLGAFPMNPGDRMGEGEKEISRFLNRVAKHVSNRATQREEEAFECYRIYKSEKPKPVSVKFAEELKPNTRKRSYPPQATYVIALWYENDDHLSWVLSSKMAFMKIEDRENPLYLRPQMLRASYVLMRTYDGQTASGLFRIKSDNEGISIGAQVITAEKLIKEHGFPGLLDASFYLVFKLNGAIEFEGFSWNLSKLPDGIRIFEDKDPFCITLDVLIHCNNRM